MTVEEYEAALRGERAVSYHFARCAAVKTLGFDPCDCGALEYHRAKLDAAAYEGAHDVGGEA